MSKEREKKMSHLQQKVYEMTEQIKSLTSNKVNGARIMQLEAELEDKTRYIEDMEDSYKRKIDDLQIQLNDKTRALNQLKEKHYMEIQFQAELDNKTRSLNDFKLKHKEKVLKLKEQIKNASDTIESLKDFQNQTVQLKSELESKDLTISQLESEIQSSQIISNQYEESQEIQKKLKSDIVKLKKFAKSLSIEKAKVENELAKSNEQIKLQKNEIAVLKAEKSFAQTQIPRTDLIFSGSPQRINKKSGYQTPNSKNSTFTSNGPHNTNDQNLDDEEMLKALLKIENLRSQLDDEKEKMRHSTELVEALKTNLKETQTDNQNMKKQLSVVESALTRKDTRIQKLKLDIQASNNQIKQKEQLINELLQAETKKCDEIERLHQEIDKLISSQKEINSREAKDEENVFKVNKAEYQELLNTLSQYKREKNQLEASIKESQARAKEIESELESAKRGASFNNQKITSLMRENAELTNVKKAYSTQVRKVEKELASQVSELKTSLEETTRENTELTRQYRDAIQSLSSYTSLVDSLRTENASLKKENGELQSTVQQQIVPLQAENSRLAENAKKFKEARDSLMKEKQRLIIENAQFKAQINHFSDSKGFQAKGADSSGISPSYGQGELEDKLSEACDNLNTLFDFLEVKSVTEFQKKWQKSVEETEDLLSKNKALEQQLESVKGKLEKISSKTDERPSNKSAASQLRSELSQEKRKAGTYLSQAEFLQQQISQLEEDNKSKDAEIAQIKRSFAEYQDQVDSIQSCVQFESIQGLKDEVAGILSENEQSKSTIKELRVLMKKLQSERDESVLKAEKQQQMIESMGSSIKELRNENLTTANKMRAENMEMANKFNAAEEAKENLLLEFNRFHELFTFEKEEDLYFAVTSEIEKMKSAMEDINFKLSQCQNKIAAKESECDFLNKNIQEKKETINQLKEERNALKNENFKLSASVKAALSDTSARQLEEVVAALEKKSAAEVIPAIAQMKSKQLKHKEKIASLKSENGKLAKQVNEVQNSLERLSIEKESVESELSILKLSNPADRDSKLEHKMSAKDDAISELKQQKGQLIRIMSEKDEKIKNFESENSSLTKVLNETRRRLQQSNNSLSEARDMLSHKVTENETLKSEIASLKSHESDISELRNKNESLSDQLSAAKDEMERFQSESKSLLQSQSNSMSRMSESNNRERMKLQNKIQKLEDQIKRKSTERLVGYVDEEEDFENENKLKNDENKLNSLLFEEEEEDAIDASFNQFGKKVDLNQNDEEEETGFNSIKLNSHKEEEETGFNSIKLNLHEEEEEPVSSHILNNDSKITSPLLFKEEEEEEEFNSETFRRLFKDGETETKDSNRNNSRDEVDLSEND